MFKIIENIAFICVYSILRNPSTVITLKIGCTLSFVYIIWSSQVALSCGMNSFHDALGFGLGSKTGSKILKSPFFISAPTAQSVSRHVSLLPTVTMPTMETKIYSKHNETLYLNSRKKTINVACLLFNVVSLLLLAFSALYRGNDSTVSTASRVVSSHFSILLAC